MKVVKPSSKRSAFFRRALDAFPGKNVFGMYRFMPIFFTLGAALEFSMINWDFKGQVNFYRTYKRRRAEEVASILTHMPSTSSPAVPTST